MQVITFLPRSERIRRTVGWLLFGASLLAAAAITLRPSGPLLINVAIVGALLAVAVTVVRLTRIVFRGGTRLEIDPAERVWRVIEGSTEHPWHPLEKLGPLEVEYRSQSVKTKQGRKTIVRYAVIGRGRPDLDLYLEKSPRRARLLMERLAKAWRLPSRSSGGDLRQPEELDQPLHERLRDSARARTPKALRPDWHVTVSEEPDAIVFRSGHRDLARTLGGPLLIAAPATFAVAMITFGGVRQLSGDEPVSSFDKLFIAGLGLACLWLAGYVVLAARDAFFPGAIEVTPEEVRYRSHRLRLEEIEEVVSITRVEIVADRKAIRLPLSWCPDDAFDAVAHELKRAIIELGAVSGSTRVRSTECQATQLSGSS